MNSTVSDVTKRQHNVIIQAGEKLHIIYRALYENSTRRHFLGEVMAVQGAFCRLQGYVFVYDDKSTDFVRKEGKRTTIVNVAESGVITNIIPQATVLEEVGYDYLSGVGLVVTDNKNFQLNINEFVFRIDG